MANPVIQAIAPPNATLQWNQELEFIVTATDGDNRTESFIIQVRDAAGNLSLPTNLPITFVDPLEVTVGIPAGSTATVTLDPVDKLKFKIKNT